MSRPKPSSRANGRLSRGPKTQAGKERSRFNGLRHGIFAKDSTLFDESSAEFNDFLARYMREYSPCTPAETRLVEIMASARWRSLLLCALETRILDHFAADEPSAGPIDCITAAFCKFADAGTAYPTLLRRENFNQLRHDRALSDLQALRSAKQKYTDRT